MLKFWIGLLLGASLSVASAQITADVTTNGTLMGYVVQKYGKDVCRNPVVWAKPFRADDQNGYIVCEH